MPQTKGSQQEREAPHLDTSRSVLKNLVLYIAMDNANMLNFNYNQGAESTDGCLLIEAISFM